MTKRLLIGLLVAGLGAASADILPLTTREVALMLRSGYSNEAVIRELQRRHFGDLIDAAQEKQLATAGASSALIETLRSGPYQASQAELETAEAKLAAAEQEQIDAHQRLRSDKKSGEGAARVSQRATSDNGNVVHQMLKDSLVCLRQGAITTFDDTELQQKKYYLFFFSANWSPEGRKFTPQLVEYYKRIKAQHPEFEVIFFSADRSQFGMETYFRDSVMPWPAVAYPQIEAKAAGMETKIVKAIPALVLVNRSGDVLSQTGGTTDPKGPDKVLADIDAILNGAKSQQVAVSHE